MNEDSTVLDLGCGYGKPLMDLARFSKMKKGVGMDLATRHVITNFDTTRMDSEILIQKQFCFVYSVSCG